MFRLFSDEIPIKFRLNSDEYKKQKAPTTFVIEAF